MLCQVRRTGVLVRPSFPSASRSLAISAEEISSSSSEGDERVDVEVQDNVAVVTLNRPEKYNALDIDMFRTIAETARSLSQQRELRGVILCGSGKAFCAGLDVKSVTSNPFNAEELLRRPKGSVSNLAQDVSLLWRSIPVPVIAAIHGVCFGGGLQIALGADFRLSTPDCKLSVMEAKWGLVPDMGGSVLLRELVSMDVAKELTMTARVFDGNQAKEYGLVTRLSEQPVADAMKLIEEIVTRSPDSVAAAKQLFNRTWRAPEDVALEMETELQRKLLMPPLQNTIAAGTKGLNLPLQMSFTAHQDYWSP